MCDDWRQVQYSKYESDLQERWRVEPAVTFWKKIRR
jgi:hypothetical protein